MESISRLVLEMRRRAANERGQTLVEYALIIALVSVALVGALAAFGDGVDGLYGVIQDAVDALSS